MRPIIYPYKIGSRSAGHLADELDTKSVRSNGHYVPRQGHAIINWGNSETPNWYHSWRRLNPNPVWLNTPAAVAVAHNKLTTFHILAALPQTDHPLMTPQWTEDRRVAEQMIQAGNIVFCRTRLTSQEGHGIVVAERLDQLVDAPLYTQYKPKKKEFRVHVFRGEVLDIQQKRHRNGEEPDPRIRSHHNGWIFSRENITAPQELGPMAIRAVNALGLDFGAVDVIWNRRENQCYVLEVNTAPGIEGASTNLYANTFKRILNEIR